MNQCACIWSKSENILRNIKRAFLWHQIARKSSTKIPEIAAPLFSIWCKTFSFDQCERISLMRFINRSRIECVYWCFIFVKSHSIFGIYDFLVWCSFAFMQFSFIFLERHKQKSSFATQGMRVKNYDLNEFTRNINNIVSLKILMFHYIHRIFSTVNVGSLQLYPLRESFLEVSP